MAESQPDRSGSTEIVRDVCAKHNYIDCVHCHFYRLPHGPQVVGIRVASDEEQRR